MQSDRSVDIFESCRWKSAIIPSCIEATSDYKDVTSTDTRCNEQRGSTSLDAVLSLAPRERKRERQMSLLFSRSPFVTAGHLQTVVASLRYCRYKWLCRGGESKLVSVLGEQDNTERLSDRLLTGLTNERLHIT